MLFKAASEHNEGYGHLWTKTYVFHLHIVQC